MVEALIIAAGQGSRLRKFYSPKPLAPIFGVRLLERIILEAKMAGIRKFKIVVGYKAEKIKREIGSGKKYGVDIEYIYNPEWEKGNGVSVLKAKGYMPEKFLLLMSDHLFDSTMLEKLLKYDLKPGHCVLCVDKNLQGDHFALDDVTKVWAENGHIRYIGKEIERFNAVDTGVFMCTSAIFEALEKSIARGEYSLAAGNQILAEQSRLQTLDVTGHFWVDVDNEEALQKAKEILIRQLFKPTDGPISRTVNRRLSTRISAYLAQYNVSPNMITLFSFGLSMLSAALFFLANYWAVLAAGVTAQLSSVLDGCDGEIARLKFKFSTFGEWLDRILDRYADGFMILGMTFASWKTLGYDWVWLVGFLALTGTFMNSYTAQPYDRLLKKNLINGRQFRLGRDVRIFIIFLGALFNQLFLVLMLLAVITNLESIRRIFVLRYGLQLEETV